MTGYPTWQVGGKFYGGYQSLDELADLSGFDLKRGVALLSLTSPAGAGGAAPASATVQGDDGCKLSDGENCK